MGKGISFLQEQILGWAWEVGGSVLMTDIVQSWWRLRDGSGPFNRPIVGEREYNQVYASISRSIERLRLRGLIRVFKETTGPPVILVFLTDAGVEVAQRLEQTQGE
jgi:hypothetical protein